ncbi:hypothetical protein Cni_G18949 [Canna indica]|uniref:Fe2OG dioxygenase domain-containing protein n=1 Tax=Canna indica TaxID=4628 RepID=A0AAQ3KKF7_9LILI|nr:hypothetical protein Cni_G18949 [Canna indica]
MANNLGIKPEEFCNIFHDQPQGIRINYYPPCPKADEVLGLSPHTDGSGLTILLQVSNFQGLQIKNKEKWFPVKPLPGALIANIGDIIEMLSNGEYKSIEHRATINTKSEATKSERLPVATFHSPREDAVVGPLQGLVKKDDKHKTVDFRDYVKALVSSKLDGRRVGDSWKASHYKLLKTEQVY